MRDTAVEMVARGAYGPVAAFVIAEGEPASADVATVEKAMASIAGNLSIFGCRLVLLPEEATVRVSRSRLRRWWRNQNNRPKEVRK